MNLDATVGLHPRRPALRWHGGKWLLAPWIISHFPSHRTYVEPYGGAGSVLLRKARSYAEIYNDLDLRVVTLFRTLRDPALSSELLRRLALTPFARTEFEAAYAESGSDPVSQSWSLIVKCQMGFGTNAHGRKSGFRANSARSGTTPAHDWRGYPEALAEIVERLRGVVIENRPALDVMAAHDGVETLHYVDPPYVAATRDRGRDYEFEMTERDHLDLLDSLQELRGAVVLSGYRCASYDARLARWKRLDRPTYADGARPRIESIWMNARALEITPAPDLLTRCAV